MYYRLFIICNQLLFIGIVGILDSELICVIQRCITQIILARSSRVDKAFAIRLAIIDWIIGSFIIVFIIGFVINSIVKNKVKSKWNSGIRITVRLKSVIQTSKNNPCSVSETFYAYEIQRLV